MAIKTGALSSSNLDPEMDSILDQNKSQDLLEPLLASCSLRSGKSYRELWFSLCMNRVAGQLRTWGLAPQEGILNV